jgi:hypothetical protein
MVISLALTILLLGTTGLLSARARGRLVLAAAATLALLGVWQLITAVVV